MSITPSNAPGSHCISLYDVVELLMQGKSEAEILQIHPCLHAEDVRACAEYAARNEHNPRWAWKARSIQIKAR